MMVWQPNVYTESRLTVFYDHTSAAAPQPEVVIESPFEMDYIAPASTGGQPDVITELPVVVELGEMQPYMDTSGTSNIAFSSNVTPSIDVELVEPPAFLTSQITRITSYVTVGAP